MKKIILLSLIWISTKSFCQGKDNPTEDYDLFISAGVHVGLWNLIGNENLTLETTPFNIHIDKVFSKKYTLGIGYSQDKFEFSPVNFFNVNFGIVRQNIRVRYYTYLTNYDKFFSIYLGGSAGCSIWTSQYDSQRTYLPTAQFLFGMKVKLNETIFWQTEFGAGPPYAIQTSIGFKF